MILVDANILIYASNTRATRHHRQRHRHERVRAD